MRRWLIDNLESLLFAFILAVSIWIAGVSAADPIEERVFPTAIPIRYTAPADGLLVVGEPPKEARLTVRAPTSVWQALVAADFQLTADLAQLGPGSEAVALLATVNRSGARITAINPGTVPVTLEEAAAKTVPVRVALTGDPASRYQAGTPQVDPSEVSVVGAASLLDTIVEAVVQVDLAGTEESLDLVADLTARDASSRPVREVDLQPDTARVRIEISLPGGFRSLAVLPQLTDQVQAGYRVTNVEVTPPTVVVFSSDPVAVENLPGFVQTELISLADAVEDISREVSVELPVGFSLVDQQSVLVEVTIEPIRSTITVNRAVEVVGLDLGRYAQTSPSTVSVLLDGPLPILEALQPQDVRVVVDLLGLGIGDHTVPVEIVVLPQGVTVGTILPETIEVRISRTPFVTPTPLP